jgi:hypothetical protein
MIPKQNILKFIAFGMLAVSALLIILGVYFYTKENAFLKECKLIICRITEIEEKRRGDAYLTFREVNGNYPPFKYNVTYDASESDLDYHVNETYEIYYYQKDVSKSEINDFFINHITSFVLLIIGVTFIIDFPIMLFVFSRVKKQQMAKQQFGIKEEVVSE